MILQTLYQQNVKQDTTFFNEFYVLDLLLAAERPGGAPRAAGVVASCPVFWADDRYWGRRRSSTRTVSSSIRATREPRSAWTC
jgi:hypothetical protein